MIFYGSVYGSAQRYSEKLGQLTGMQVEKLSADSKLSSDEPSIFILSVYAGKLTSQKLASPLIAQNPDSCLLGIVGLADPEAPDTWINNKKQAEQAGIPLKDDQIFPLYGAIDYSRLSWIHRMMMAFMYQMLKKNPAGNEVFLESYGKAVSLEDEKWLQPIAARIKPQSV